MALQILRIKPYLIPLKNHPEPKPPVANPYVTGVEHHRTRIKQELHQLLVLPVACFSQFEGADVPEHPKENLLAIFPGGFNRQGYREARSVSLTG